jgi:hypothetical protein
VPQHVEFGGLREHMIDPAAVYEITLRGCTARRPDRKISVDSALRAIGGHSSLAPRGRSSGVDGLIERLSLVGIALWSRLVRRRSPRGNALALSVSIARSLPEAGECSHNARNAAVRLTRSA